ncbi:hypothetical protein RRG08_013160 [Elysia crispata]|uniref:Uncharacterized protein n=1 Tax=Elysia crispata TaxID=231223 RepID=A0AAE1A0X0_9GAST|nr:hypothetical protein RRG08_013160 [Elysia crispata]
MFLCISSSPHQSSLVDPNVQLMSSLKKHDADHLVVVDSPKSAAGWRPPSMEFGRFWEGNVGDFLERLQGRITPRLVSSTPNSPTHTPGSFIRRSRSRLITPASASSGSNPALQFLWHHSQVWRVTLLLLGGAR